MPLVSARSIKKAIDIKSTTTDLMSIVLNQANPEAIASVLDKRFAQNNSVPSWPYLLDLSHFDSPDLVDLKALLPIFSKYPMHIIGLRHSDSVFEPLATAHGLIFCPARGTLAPEPIALPSTAMVVDKPVRTGQQIYAQGGDLVVLNMVSAGAEVVADGHIHIYAPLRGRALAGAKGDKKARIFVQSMEAELVAIAGIYRTLEQKLPASMREHMIQIYLEQDRLVMKAVVV